MPTIWNDSVIKMAIKTGKIFIWFAAAILINVTMWRKLRQIITNLGIPQLYLAPTKQNRDDIDDNTSFQPMASSRLTHVMYVPCRWGWETRQTTGFFLTAMRSLFTILWRKRPGKRLEIWSNGSHSSTIIKLWISNCDIEVLKMRRLGWIGKNSLKKPFINFSKILTQNSSADSWKVYIQAYYSYYYRYSIFE